MASSRTKKAYLPFSDATNVVKLDSQAYRVSLCKEFCIGAVPNGGYTLSCMLAAARVHLAPRGQPDTITAHVEYPGRATVGPAVVTIEEVKFGKQLSTLQLTLWQNGLVDHAPWITPSESRRIVIAHTNHADLRGFLGISIPTGYQVSPAAELPSLPNLNGADGVWEESRLPPSAGPVDSLRNWRFFLPKSGPLTPGVLDMWIRTASGEPMTQAMLPYVADSFPFNLHTFLVAPELRELLEPPRDRSESSSSREARSNVSRQNEQRAGMWFPTIVMNLETKTMLPEEGTEWLAVRVTSKQIKDGRFDLEVLIRDLDGEILALGHHVAMILNIERNTGKKTSTSKAAL